MKMILVGGQAGSGKNTVGEMVAEYCHDKGLSTITLGNADAVRKYALKYFNLMDYKTDEGRRVMTGLSEMMYELYPNYWEKQSLETIRNREDKYEKSFDVAIITDWRYPMTYEFFKDMFNVNTLYVKRMNPNNYAEDVTQNRAEREETLRKYIDYTLYNFDTLDSLQRGVNQYLEYGVFKDANK